MTLEEDIDRERREGRRISSLGRTITAMIDRYDREDGDVAFIVVSGAFIDDLERGIQPAEVRIEPMPSSPLYQMVVKDRD